MLSAIPKHRWLCNVIELITTQKNQLQDKINSDVLKIAHSLSGEVEGMSHIVEQLTKVVNDLQRVGANLNQLSDIKGAIEGPERFLSLQLESDYLSLFQAAKQQLFDPLLELGMTWLHSECNGQETQQCLQRLVTLLFDIATNCEYYLQRSQPSAHEQIKTFYTSLLNVVKMLMQVFYKHPDLLNTMNAASVITLLKLNLQCMHFAKSAYNAYEANQTLTSLLTQYQHPIVKSGDWLRAAEVLERTTLSHPIANDGFGALRIVATASSAMIRPLLADDRMTLANYEEILKKSVTKIDIKIRDGHYLFSFLKYQMHVEILMKKWRQKDYGACLSLLDQSFFTSDFHEISLRAIFYVLNPEVYTRYSIMRMYHECVRLEDGHGVRQHENSSMLTMLFNLPKRCTELLCNETSDSSYVFEHSATAMLILNELKEIDIHYSEHARAVQSQQPEVALRILLEQKKWYLASKCDEAKPGTESFELNYADLIPFLALYQKTAARLWRQVQQSGEDSVPSLHQANYKQAITEMSKMIIPLLRTRELKPADGNKTLDVILPQLDFEPRFMITEQKQIAVVSTREQKVEFLQRLNANGSVQLLKQLQQVMPLISLGDSRQSEAFKAALDKLFAILPSSWFIHYKRNDLRTALSIYRELIIWPEILKETTQVCIQLLKFLYLYWRCLQIAQQDEEKDKIKIVIRLIIEMTAQLLDFIKNDNALDMIVAQTQLVNLAHIQLYLVAMQVANLSSLKPILQALSHDAVVKKLDATQNPQLKDQLFQSQLAADKMKRQLKLAMRYPFLTQSSHLDVLTTFQAELSKQVWNDDTKTAAFNRGSYSSLRQLTDEQFWPISVYCEFAYNVMQLYACFSSLDSTTFNLNMKRQLGVMLAFNLQDHNDLCLFLSPDIYFRYSMISAMHPSDAREKQKVIAMLRAVYKEFMFPALGAIYPLQQQQKAIVNLELLEIMIQLAELTTEFVSCKNQKEKEQVINTLRESPVWNRIAVSMQLRKETESQSMKWEDLFPFIKDVVDHFICTTDDLLRNTVKHKNGQGRVAQRHTAYVALSKNKEPETIKQWHALYAAMHTLLPKVILDDFAFCIEKLTGTSLRADIHSSSIAVALPLLVAAPQPIAAEPFVAATATVSVLPAPVAVISTMKESAAILESAEASNPDAIATLTSENQRLREELNQMRHQRDTTVSSLQDKIKNQRGQTAMLKHQVAELEGSNQQLRAEIEASQSAGAKYEKSKEQMGRRLQDKSQRIQELEAQQKECDQSYQENLQKILAQINLLNAEHKRLQEQNVALLSQIKNLNSDVLEREERLTHLQALNVSLGKTVDSLHRSLQQREALQGQLDEEVAMHADALSRFGFMFVKEGTARVLAPARPFFDLRATPHEPGYGPVPISRGLLYSSRQQSPSGSTQLQQEQTDGRDLQSEAQAQDSPTPLLPPQS